MNNQGLQPITLAAGFFARASLAAPAREVY